MGRTDDPANTSESRLDRELATELEQLSQSHLLRSMRTISGRQAPRMRVDGRDVLLFAGANYLGLAGEPRVLAAAHAALDQAGCAAGGARLISGNTPYHEELERELALFLGTEAALLFSTGYVANLGVITALAGPDDLIFSDELNHASIIDAVRLTRAEVVVFPHNDPDRLAQLARVRTGYRRRLLVMDGVFSMDGDVARLDAFAVLARAHQLVFIVDDAHGIGVLGPTGRGACERFGVQPDIQIGNLGKALGSFGAFVACSHVVRDYLINRSRPFIFTCGLPPALVAAAREALRIARSEPERRHQVLELADGLRQGLRAQGFTVGSSSSQIVPVILGDNEETMRVAATALAQGVYAQGIRFPSVPAGTARLRLTPMFGHTPEDVARVTDILAKVAKRALHA